MPSFTWLHSTEVLVARNSNSLEEASSPLVLKMSYVRPSTPSQGCALSTVP